MTQSWPTARDALVALIEGMGADVFRVPPASGDALGRSVSVIMIPPQRRTTRRRSSNKQKVYTQRMDVLHPWAAGSEDTAGIAVDDAVEAIDNALDTSVKLGGAVVTVGDPEWGDAQVADYPPGSGRWYVQQSGTVAITLEFSITTVA